MPPQREVERLAYLLVVAAVERCRADQHILTTHRALAHHRAQRHAIDLVLHKHSREDASLAVVASVENDRLAAEIGIHFERLDEAVAEDAVAVEGAGRLFVETMLAEVALACDDHPAAAMRAAVLQIDAVRHHLHLSATALKVCEILFSLVVLEGHDVACARVLEFLDDVIRENDTTNFLFVFQCDCCHSCFDKRLNIK